MQPPRHVGAGFEHSPMLVFYEVTRACDLACQHCRACAQPQADPDELTTAQAKSLIGQLAGFPRRPLLVFTGGDPIKRRDIFELVGHAADAGLATAMTPSATPLVTGAVLARLKQAGLHRLAVSLDGVDAATHEHFRGVAGSFATTLRILADARSLGLPLQVNTTITQHNVQQVDALAELLSGLGIVLWSIFFLVPVGRARPQQRLSAEQTEAVFQQLYLHSQRQPYAIKTTEAPHYRRYLAQHNTDKTRPMAGPGMAGTNDGKGILFVSHSGQIYPSGFMPILCGRFPADSVVEVYQHSPVFQALRDANRLEGKCGQCEFRHLCGGSRARSFALSGNMHAPEPDCSYVPARNRAGTACL